MLYKFTNPSASDDYVIVDAKNKKQSKQQAILALLACQNQDDVKKNFKKRYDVVKSVIDKWESEEVTPTKKTKVDDIPQHLIDLLKEMS